MEKDVNYFIFNMNHSINCAYLNTAVIDEKEFKCMIFDKLDSLFANKPLNLDFIIENLIILEECMDLIYKYICDKFNYLYEKHTNRNSIKTVLSDTSNLTALLMIQGHLNDACECINECKRLKENLTE